MAIDVRSDSPTVEATRADRPVKKNVTSPVGKINGRRAGRGWKRGVAAVCGVALLLAILGSFMLGDVSPTNADPKLTHTVARRDLRVTVTEQGSLESSNNTEVRCKVKGASSTIVWIVENGTMVKPGDVLVRIDTSTIETNINTQEIAYQNALATYAQSESDVAVAEINVVEYVKGTYRSELKTKEKDVAIAEANLRSAQNMLNHAKEMYRKGFMSKLELEGNEYSLQQAVLELEVKQTDVDVLKEYTRAKQIKDLEGILAAKKAKLASDKASLNLEKEKLDSEKRQLENCVILSESSGMVIYDEVEEWEDRPDIRAGATVREDQVLLLIPDLTEMQVKVGIHEAKVDQIKPGMPAEIKLQDKIYEGEVHSVAPMAERSGWWNGNMVRYTTVIKLKSHAALKPGMSADVEIFLAEHENVLVIPVAAIVEQEGRFYCWVNDDAGMQRRELELGDSDDQFLVVQAGVHEGEEVVINPIAYVEQARRAALRPFSGRPTTKSTESIADKNRTPSPSDE